MESNLKSGWHNTLCIIIIIIINSFLHLRTQVLWQTVRRTHSTLRGHLSKAREVCVGGVVKKNTTHKLTGFCTAAQSDKTSASKSGRMCISSLPPRRPSSGVSFQRFWGLFYLRTTEGGWHLKRASLLFAAEDQMADPSLPLTNTLSLHPSICPCIHTLTHTRESSSTPTVTSE